MTTENPQPQDPALAAYQAGDFATAFAKWLPLADQGDANAQFNIALMYHNGQGTEPDNAKTYEYCRRAAEQNHPHAQHYLGYLLQDESFGTPDEAAAAQWWRRAAEQGIDDAQFQLGVLYTEGRGVPQDNDEAADWYEAAALKGHALAQFNLGVLYANARQYSHARHWWNKSAEQGNEDARSALAKLDEMGL